jgi:hypothetical protein
MQNLLEDLALDLVERLMASGIDRRVVDEDVELGSRRDRLPRDRCNTVLGGELAEDRDATELLGSGPRIGLAACMAENAGSLSG